MPSRPRLAVGHLEHRPCVFSLETEGCAMASGTIKKVVSDRGFGFITGEDGNDYFFHREGLAPMFDFDRLRGGERVEFDLERNPRGPRATNVRPPGSAA